MRKPFMLIILLMLMVFAFSACGADNGEGNIDEDTETEVTEKVKKSEKSNEPDVTESELAVTVETEKSENQKSGRETDRTANESANETESTTPTKSGKNGDNVNKDADYTASDDDYVSEDYPLELFDGILLKTSVNAHHMNKYSLAYPSGEVLVIAEGNYQYPSINQDGTKLAFVGNYYFDSAGDITFFVYDIVTKMYMYPTINNSGADYIVMSPAFVNDEDLVVIADVENNEYNVGGGIYYVDTDSQSMHKIIDAVDCEFTYLYLEDDEIKFCVATSTDYNYQYTDISIDKINALFSSKTIDEIHFDADYTRKIYSFESTSDANNNGSRDLKPYRIGDFFSLDDYGFAITDPSGKLYGYVGDYNNEMYNEWYNFYMTEKAVASSTLKNQGTNNYDANNMTRRADTREKCWVEGASGYGVGEYVDVLVNIYNKYEIDFSGSGSHEFDRVKVLDDITEDSYLSISYSSLCIVNGYAKNLESWKNNSRVKTLKMYINNIYHSNIEIEDTIKPQYFDFTNFPVKMNEETVFRFEIADVYKGDKYEDTCITSIKFDFAMSYDDEN